MYGPGGPAWHRLPGHAPPGQGTAGQMLPCNAVLREAPMSPNGPVHDASITWIFDESSLRCSGGGGSGAFLRLASGRTAARHTLGGQQSQAATLTSQASSSTQGVSPAYPPHHRNTCTAGAADPPCDYVICLCWAPLNTGLGVPSSVCRNEELTCSSAASWLARRAWSCRQ